MEARRLGRYELISVLGRGGSGVVYEAVMHGVAGFRKRVAVKLLDERQGDTTDGRSLQREARLGALLSHPNVVSILDLGRVGEHWFIAMELVTGAPVSALLRPGPLPPTAILDIGVQACAGLAHIHGLRVDGSPAALVHRDVKPQNLLVDENGVVKIADFGIAALAGTIEAVGTPTWMAPEQLAGRTSPRSDLFALGAVLYALAALRPPFGTGRKAFVEARRAEVHLGTPAFMAAVDAAVPGLGEVLTRCLRLDPADRWPDAAKLGAALRALRARHPGGGGLVERVAAVRGLTVREGTDGGTPHDPTAETVVLTPPAGIDLPPADATFVGRAEPNAELVELLLGGERLVTVLGPGGVGKSRLALAAATTVGRRLQGGALGLPLAEARSPDAICSVAATRLKLAPTGVAPVEQIGHALRNRGPVVVVLDDVERARDALADVLARWLELAPEARFLVTSRMPLRMRAERTLSLGPLDVADGVLLFRARAVNPPSPEDDPIVAQLVRALDGLPLAIELAAARSRVMSPKMLLERLGDRFRLLSGDSREGRHATLRASIAASWELLQPWEAAAMGQLAVFVDGVALDDAEAGLDLAAWTAAPWALDVLSALVDMSLLRFDAKAERFRMMVSVQEYALATLSPQARAEALVRHGETFARLGHPDVLEQMHGHGGERVRARMHAERDNVIAACERAIARGDAEVAVSAGMCAAAVLRDLGPLVAGEQLVTQVLALPELSRRHELLLARGHLRWFIGRREGAREDLDRARDLAEAAGDARAVLGARSLLTRLLPPDEAHLAELASMVEEARRHGETRAEARALSMLGMVHKERWELGPARSCLEQALVLFERIGNRQGEALAQLRLGQLDRHEGRHAAALKRSEESVRLFRALGDRVNASTALENLAICHTDAGRTDEARAAFEAVIAHEREMGHLEGEGSALANLAVLDRWGGRLAEARAKNERAFRLFSESGSVADQARVLGNLALVDAMIGELASARRHLERSRDLWRASGRLVEADAVAHVIALQLLAEELPEQALRELESVTVALPDAQAFDHGVARVAVLARLGRARDAARALAVIEPLAVARREWRVEALAIARARVALASNDAATAQRHLAEVETTEQPAVWLLRAEVLHLTGDLARRDRALAAARALEDKAGSRPGSPGMREVARLASVFGRDPRDSRTG